MATALLRLRQVLGPQGDQEMHLLYFKIPWPASVVGRFNWRQSSIADSD